MFQMLQNTWSGRISNTEFNFDRFHEITMSALEI